MILNGLLSADKVGVNFRTDRIPRRTLRNETIGWQIFGGGIDRGRLCSTVFGGTQHVRHEVESWINEACYMCSECAFYYY